MTVTLPFLAEALDAEALGDEALEITGVKGMDTASPGHLTFIDHPRLLGEAEACEASAVIVPLAVKSSCKPILRVKNPRLAFARALEIFNPAPSFAPGVDERAIVEDGAVLEEGCAVGANCLIGAGARIAAGARIMPLCVIGAGSTVGRNALLYPGVRVYPGVAIGEGATIYAHAFLGCGPTRSLALAGEMAPADAGEPGDFGLVIEERVEIGSRAVVERGLTRDTVIGAGTKIDNMAMIYHGCRLGRHVIVVSTSCIGPNTTVGDWCVFAAQSHAVGHLEIGKGSIIAGRCILRTSVPPGSIFSGEPARDHKEELRISANLLKLAEYLRERPEFLP